MNSIRDIILLPLGWALVQAAIWFCGPYRGGGWVKVRSQTASGIVERVHGAAIRAYLINRLRLDDIARGYDYAARTRLVVGPSARVLADYTDPSGHGYNEAEYRLGGDSVETQQRGLLLPLLLPALRGTVIEIGTGNGDVIAWLAERHPTVKFIGVDFNVENARRKYPALDFRQGYALEMIPDIAPDVAFCSSTMACFTWAEINAYIGALRAAGCKTIVINEPHWYSADPLALQYSVHLEGVTWVHPYRAVLEKHGYRITEYSDRPYIAPISARPDIRVILIRADAM